MAVIISGTDGTILADGLISAASIQTSDVSAVEFSYLKNTTGEIQSQINAISSDLPISGTWVPTLTGSTTSGTSPTYTTRQGTYTKVGNFVTAFWNIEVEFSTDPTGRMEVSGLPFTPASGVYGYGSFRFIEIVWATTISDYYPYAVVDPSLNRIRLQEASMNSARTPETKDSIFWNDLGISSKNPYGLIGQVVYRV